MIPRPATYPEHLQRMAQYNKGSGPGRGRTYDQVIMSHSASSDNDLSDNDLRDDPSDGCTNGCTVSSKIAHENRIEALAAAIRSLTQAERAALRAMLKEPGDE